MPKTELLTMIAERIQYNSLSPTPRYQTLTALFADEAAAEELVNRLAFYNLEPHTATIIGVALGEPIQRLDTSRLNYSANATCHTTTGIFIGCVVGLLIGLILYGADFLHLSFLEAMLIHTLALIVLGGVIGGAAGTILASLRSQQYTVPLPPQHAEGFLVTIKIPSPFIPQGEAIARELGARKIIA